MVEKRRYCQSKELAQRVLLEYGVRGLPIDMGPLCRKMGVTAKLFIPDDENDGISIIVDGKPFIFVGETSSPERQRFTAAHEVGHIVQGHVGSWTTDDGARIYGSKCDDREATAFAVELIMPMCVLIALGITTVDQIMHYCGVGYLAAQRRLEEMQKRQKRQEVLSLLEGQVNAQFAEYIENNKINHCKLAKGI